jgi:hypothetical protein
MTTVIAVYSSEGCVGRCDARCHEAVKHDCDCICGGKNHGVGVKQAIANNHERIGLTPEDLERFARLHGFKADELRVYDALQTPTSKIRRQRAKEKKAEQWRKLLQAP